MVKKYTIILNKNIQNNYLTNNYSEYHKKESLYKIEFINYGSVMLL